MLIFTETSLDNLS